MHFGPPSLTYIILTSQANIKLEQYGYAIADAAKAIELDSGYAKVYDDFHRNGGKLLTRYRHTIGEQSPTPPSSTPVLL